MLKKITLAMLVLAGCGTKYKKTEESVAVVSEQNLIAMATEDLNPSSKLQTKTIQYHLTENDQTRLEKNYPQTLEKIENQKPLSLQDIKNLTRAGVSDPAIIHQIKATRSIFYLTKEDEKELSQAGVSNKVILVMRETSQVSY